MIVNDTVGERQAGVQTVSRSLSENAIIDTGHLRVTNQSGVYFQKRQNFMKFDAKISARWFLITSGRDNTFENAQTALTSS